MPSNFIPPKSFIYSFPLCRAISYLATSLNPVSNTSLLPSPITAVPSPINLVYFLVAFSYNVYPPTDASARSGVTDNVYPPTDVTAVAVGQSQSQRLYSGATARIFTGNNPSSPPQISLLIRPRAHVELGGLKCPCPFGCNGYVTAVAAG